jgi:HNH endonuclease
MGCSERSQTPVEIPPGYCQCGCGGRTSIARQTNRSLGWVKGEPVRFICGHHGRKSRVDYLVEDRGFRTPCWVWQLGLIPSGYGMLRDPNGNMVRAPRHYYEQKFGPISAGLQVDHLCRVRACVNPDHLEPVTQTENIRRGAGTKLDEVAVRTMRASSDSQADLAKRYGISQGHVSRIKKRLTWRDLD